MTIKIPYYDFYFPLLCIGLFLCFNLSSSQTKIKIGIWENYDKYTLPDSCIYKNPKEYKNNIDDDGNGYIDDINGIGFDSAENLIPEYFYAGYENHEKYDHGTAVGYILTENNPNVLIYGVSFVPTTKRLNEHLLKLTTEERLKNLPNEYKQMENFIKNSIDYFAQNKVKVVNISWGLDLNRVAELNTNFGKDSISIRKQSKKWLNHFKKYLTKYMKARPNIIFVVAAGNEGKDIEKAIDVPASIKLKNIITVGSKNENNEISEFSNYGENITVYESGENITYKKALKITDKGDGTSLAAPKVTAYVAKELSKNKTCKEIKTQLKNMITFKIETK